ncbi:MAG TPA: ATP-binding protein [Chloroflexota bacterium]|nr:ATP-binding protein [Chloroflexota bacterium]
MGTLRSKLRAPGRARAAGDRQSGGGADRTGAVPLGDRAAPAAQDELRRLLGSRRDDVAVRWHQAIAGTSFVPFSAGEVRQRLVELTDRAIRVLLGDVFQRREAEAVGATLVDLRYLLPDALRGTQEVLGGQLVADLPAEHALALQPRLAALLGAIATGFYEQARRTILSEQEEIRAALLTAREEAEAALWASEARFRAVYDAAAIGIGLADMAGRILDMNPALQGMLGYTADELRSMNVTEFTHPDDRTTDWELYRQLAAGERDHFAIEKRFYRKDGRIVWCDLTASLVRDAAGRPLFSIALMEDITERKQAQETIRQLNADLERRVAERTVQLAVANQELAEEIARRGRAEAQRLRLLAEEQAARREAEAARQRLAFLAEASKVLASSLDYETTLQRVAHLAVPTLADWCFVDVADRDGSIRRLAVAHADQSKAQLAQELRASFPTRADAPDGVPMVLRTGQPELIAEAAGRLEMLLPSIGQPDEARHLEILRQIDPKSWMVVPLAARGSVLGAVTFVAAESGRRYGPADLALADDLARRAGLAVDNARLYQATQEALAVREEFLSVAAHELKTPMTSIVGYTQMALAQLERPAGVDLERLGTVLRALEQQAAKFGGLVSQLLDLSRIEGGQLALERAMTDLSRLVEDVVARARLGSSRHTINVHAPATVPAFVDPVRVEQVLTNLLSNAVKFSPAGGAIDVEVSTAEPRVVSIAVRDRGIGIPAEHQPRIFDRFYRVRTNGGLAGMGLGLFISRQIVELHGGRIGVESPPGGGARFVVTLPVAADGPDTGAAA